MNLNRRSQSAPFPPPLGTEGSPLPFWKEDLRCFSSRDAGSVIKDKLTVQIHLEGGAEEGLKGSCQ